MIMCRNIRKYLRKKTEEQQLEKEHESDNKVQKTEDRDVENNLQKKCSVLITLDDVTNALEYISAQKDAETKPKRANKMPKKNIEF